MGCFVYHSMICGWVSRVIDLGMHQVNFKNSNPACFDRPTSTPPVPPVVWHKSMCCMQFWPVFIDCMSIICRLKIYIANLDLARALLSRYKLFSLTRVLQRWARVERRGEWLWSAADRRLGSSEKRDPNPDTWSAPQQRVRHGVHHQLWYKWVRLRRVQRAQW